jgi:hypothetical protein
MIPSCELVVAGQADPGDLRIFGHHQKRGRLPRSAQVVDDRLRVGL